MPAPVQDFEDRNAALDILSEFAYHASKKLKHAAERQDARLNSLLCSLPFYAASTKFPTSQATFNKGNTKQLLTSLETGMA